MNGFVRSPAAGFEPARALPTLARDEIHVWLHVGTSGDPRHIAAAARARLDALLVHYAALDRAPDIARSERGKPYAPALADVDFNLSHAGHLALIAIARAQPLGVDLEGAERAIRVEALARRFFAKPEADALDALPAERRPEAFLRLWTCKEAVLKALGVGISFGLDRVAFSLDAAGMPAAIAALDGEAGRPEEWRIVLLDPAPEFLGALAWHGPPRRVRLFRADRDA